VNVFKQLSNCKVLIISFERQRQLTVTMPQVVLVVSLIVEQLLQLMLAACYEVLIKSTTITRLWEDREAD